MFTYHSTDKSFSLFDGGTGIVALYHMAIPYPGFHVNEHGAILAVESLPMLPAVATNRQSVHICRDCGTPDVFGSYVGVTPNGTPEHVTFWLCPACEEREIDCIIAGDALFGTDSGWYAVDDPSKLAAILASWPDDLSAAFVHVTERS